MVDGWAPKWAYLWVALRVATTVVRSAFLLEERMAVSSVDMLDLNLVARLEKSLAGWLERKLVVC